MYYCEACGHIQQDYIATSAEMMTHGRCSAALRSIESQVDVHQSLNATFERQRAGNTASNGEQITLIMLGKVNVGKTTMCQELIRLNGTIPEDTSGSTASPDMLMTTLDGMRVYLWDTCDQTVQCGAIADMYYRVAHGCLLTYDITDLDSFTALEDILKKARERCKVGTVFALVGNKSDTDPEMRRVAAADANRFARRQGMTLFFETSAVTGEGILAAFSLMCRTVVLMRGTIQSLSDTFTEKRASPKVSGPKSGTKKSTEKKCCLM